MITFLSFSKTLFLIGYVEFLYQIHCDLFNQSPTVRYLGCFYFLLLKLWDKYLCIDIILHIFVSLGKNCWICNLLVKGNKIFLRLFIHISKLILERWYQFKPQPSLRVLLLHISSQPNSSRTTDTMINLCVYIYLSISYVKKWYFIEIRLTFYVSWPLIFLLL